MRAPQPKWGEMPRVLTPSGGGVKPKRTLNKSLFQTFLGSRVEQTAPASRAKARGGRRGIIPSPSGCPGRNRELISPMWGTSLWASRWGNV
jgi:hypothetical protein